MIFSLYFTLTDITNFTRMSNVLELPDKQREKLFTGLYKKAFPALAKYISAGGGSFDEAKDVFQDALVIYYERFISTGAAVNSSEKAYILGVSKYLWIKRYRQNNVTVPLDTFDIERTFAEEETPELSHGKLLLFLETAGAKCMELLRAFFYDKIRAGELAERFGYTSIHSATVQKYKCLEKVRNQIKKRSLSYEDFVE